MAVDRRFPVGIDVRGSPPGLPAHAELAPSEERAGTSPVCSGRPSRGGRPRRPPHGAPGRGRYTEWARRARRPIHLRLPREAAEMMRVLRPACIALSLAGLAAPASAGGRPAEEI